jgi:cysteine desulfurase
VQGFLKLPISFRTLHADLISISGHKVHASKGVGALYVSKGVRISKNNLGGKQEKGFRGGTEALPNIAGFGSAVDTFYPTIQSRWDYVTTLKDYLLSSLSPLSWVTVNSKEDSSPYIVNISVQGIRSEIMLHFLESKGVYVSSGSACSKGEKSGVLGQFGLNDKLSDSAIRVSFCETNTTQDIDALVTALQQGFESILKS